MALAIRATYPAVLTGMRSAELISRNGARSIFFPDPLRMDSALITDDLAQHLLH